MTIPAVTINSSVLRWARESSGYSLDYVAGKTKLAQSKILQWEETSSEIPFTIVERLAKVFKRPAIVLLKDAPPIEPVNPPYFRKSNGRAELSPEARVTIRKVRNLQRISKELIEDLDLRSAHIFDYSLLNKLPEQVAETERKVSGISFEEQTGWKSSFDALKQLRGMIEKKKIFVFQIGMPIEQMQGLSLIDEAAPAIVLNLKDIPERRIFTLLHEYAHILVGSPGVCADIDQPIGNSRGLETWCNRFAGAFLVPKKELSEFVESGPVYAKMDYKAIQSIARHYHVSSHMMFVRLKVCGLISDADSSTLSKVFENITERAPKKVLKKEGKREGSVPQYKKIISERGAQFVNLVLENEGKKKISTAEALDYLSIKLESLEKMKLAAGR